MDDSILTKDEIERRVLDGMVLWAKENDDDIDAAVKIIDEKSKEKGISFYDMAKTIDPVKDMDVDASAREWLNKKQRGC